MKLKKSVMLLSIASMVSAFSFNSAFAATTKQCDNDPSASGCSMTLFPSGSSHWSYGTGSGLNSDYRINSTSNSGEIYGWGVTGVTKGGSTTVKAYLANSNFTNRSADYYYGWARLSTYITLTTSFDQFNASSGWNTVGSTSVSGTGTYTAYVDLSSDGTSSTNTGADGIQIVSP